MLLKAVLLATQFLTLFVLGQAQGAPQPVALEPRKPVERTIGGGESHTYQISLAAGQFVRFRLAQRAIDKVLTLTAPGGKLLVEMDVTGAGSEESLSLEIATTGSYRVTVRGKGRAEMLGSYGLEATLQTSPTAQDRKREAAERLLVEENELLKQGDKMAQQRIEKLDQALLLLRELGDNYWIAMTIKKIGINYYYLKQYEKAADHYEQALSIFREGKNRSDEGDVLFRLSFTAYGLNRFEKAIEYAEQAGAIAREVKARKREAETLSNISNFYYSLGQTEKSIAYTQQALAVTREMKDREGEATMLTNLGLMYNGLGRSEKAIEFLEQALAIARELKDRATEMYTLKSLGDSHFQLDRKEKAIEYYEQSLVVSRESKDQTVEAGAARNVEAGALLAIGKAYAALSRGEKAIEYYEQVLAISREAGIRVGELYALEALGEVYGSLGRNEKAIEYLEQALSGFREVRNRHAEAGTLDELGAAYQRMGGYEKAVEYYERALPIYRELKVPIGEAAVLSRLGIVSGYMGRTEKAIEYLEQARAIYREVKNRSGEGYTLDKLGLVYSRLNRPEKAIEYHQEALAISRAVNLREMEASALYGLASAERARGNLSASRTHIEQSLTIVESLRSNEISSPELRASFLTSFQNSYQLYTDVLMSQHRAEPTKAFDALAVETSERQRARSLLDLLAESRTDLRQGVDTELLERERRLGKQLSDKAQRLTQANKPEQSAALKQEISQLENDYERAQAAIRKASPKYAALTQPQPLKLKEIQAQLDADTLLLEYALGEDRSYLWAITKDSLTSYDLPKEELIKQNALQVYEMLTARNTKKSGETEPQRKTRVTDAEAKLPAAAEALSKMLLVPAAAQFDGKRLVIVADGALQYIPFAMLPDPAAGKKQPLIVGHEVISLPSASALAIQRTELAGRKPALKLLAVIADPVFDRTDTRFKTAPAETSNTMQASLSADTRGLEHIADMSGDKSGKLVIRRLPFTRQEADGLMALTPKESSWRAIDFQASRANVLNGDLSQFRYVHFATHGLLDTERPGLSSLVLSTVDADGKPQDGFLRANDIYNMKLPAELVVLSACQTGLGKEVKGEGLIGLTRGFMYAGAKRVVVSLWSVNDKATSDLMTKFYRGMLKNNERPSAALRAAQIAMWKHEKWNTPYYWAAFTMQGEWK